MPNKILVSAGHSTVPPRDSGATGNGFIEAVEALKVRDAVAALLRLKNIDVIMDGIDGESELAH
jgi:N-acetylmuramoyl-L-alanine amidase